MDFFFLQKVENIVNMEREVKANVGNMEVLQTAKEMGFSDHYIAAAWNKTEREIYDMRKENNMMPVFKMVDTCAAEFESATPYYYSTYADENESIVTDRKSVVVLGCGASALVKVLSLITQQFTQYGQLKKLDMKQLSLTTTQKQFQQTSVFLTNYTLNH